MKKIFSTFLSVFFVLVFLAPENVSAEARSLYLGLSGSDVVSLQQALITKGYLAPGSATGYFGAKTNAALKKFQCDQNIICTGSNISGYGIYGPRTRALLSSSPTTKSFELSGWIPYWRATTGSADVLPHLSALTSVMPFGYTVRNDGTIEDTAKLLEEPWVSFISAAKQNKVRIVPTLRWNDGAAIHKVLSDATKRVALEDAITDLVKKNGFDGIDIDFESKKHETIDYFSTFLKGLYTRMGNKWVYCTVEARTPVSERYSPGATIPPDATNYANDYAEMNKYCDRVEIMAYDQGTVDVALNDTHEAPYAPLADPAWVESVVNLATQSIAKNKILLGVPTYGYEYTVTALGNSGYQYTRLWSFNPKYATDLAAQLGINPSRNSANEMSFVYHPNLLSVPPASTQADQLSLAASTTVAENTGSQTAGNQTYNYVTWSDAQAIATKVALAKKLGLRGIAVFKFDGGESPDIWSVLK